MILNYMWSHFEKTPEVIVLKSQPSLPHSWSTSQEIKSKPERQQTEREDKILIF